MNLDKQKHIADNVLFIRTRMFIINHLHVLQDRNETVPNCYGHCAYSVRFKSFTNCSAIDTNYNGFNYERSFILNTLQSRVFKKTISVCGYELLYDYFEICFSLFRWKKNRLLINRYVLIKREPFLRSMGQLIKLRAIRERSKA